MRDRNEPHTLKKGSHLGFPAILVGFSNEGGLISSFRSSPTARSTFLKYRLTVSPDLSKFVATNLFLRLCPTVLRNIATCSSTHRCIVFSSKPRSLKTLQKRKKRSLLSRSMLMHVVSFFHIFPLRYS